VKEVATEEVATVRKEETEEAAEASVKEKVIRERRDNHSKKNGNQSPS